MKAPPNIKPNPVFIRTPGQPTAAPPPDRYDSKGWPIWNGGKPIDEVLAQEARDALAAQYRANDKARRAERREKMGDLCLTCKGRSVEWRVGTCPRCHNSGRRL